MPEYSGWIDLFFDLPDEAFEQLPLVDARCQPEHGHMWEMVGQGWLHCWVCGEDARLPRQRSSLSGFRGKPGER